MRIEIPIVPGTKSVYLQQLKHYPDEECQPTYDPQRTLATLDLSLKDVYRCGITRVVNKITVSISEPNSTRHTQQFDIPTNFHPSRIPKVIHFQPHLNSERAYKFFWKIRIH